MVLPHLSALAGSLAAPPPAGLAIAAFWMALEAAEAQGRGAWEHRGGGSHRHQGPCLHPTSWPAVLFGGQSMGELDDIGLSPRSTTFTV